MKPVKPRTLYRTRSKIQTIEMRKEAGRVTLYLDGNIQFVSGEDDIQYHHSLATVPALLVGNKTIRALVLGGGDGLVARNLIKLPNVVHVTQVELDPAMIDFSRKNPFMKKLNCDSFNHPKVKVVCGDARKFVIKAPKASWDLVVLDFPDPDRNTVDLFTTEFLSKAVALLRSGGVIAIQASSANAGIEHDVQTNLEFAIGDSGEISVVHFQGKFMEDGAIVVGKLN